MTAIVAIVKSKSAGILIGFVAAYLGFNIAENLTGNNWISIIVSAVCFVIVTRIKTRPKTIEAETRREQTLREQTQKEVADLFTEIHRHAGNRDSFYQKQIERLMKLTSLMTITKHALANENQGLTSHLDLLEVILREHGIDYPEFEPKSLIELTSEEDRIRADIVGITLPEP